MIVLVVGDTGTSPFGVREGDNTVSTTGSRSLNDLVSFGEAV